MQPTIDRVHERRRKKRLRRLCRIVCIAAVGYMLNCGWNYVHNPDFAFGSISVRGTSLLTDADLVKMGGSQMPLNLFNISLSRMREALNHDIRFHSAEVAYKFPSHIQVIVQEREPALYVSNSYRSYFKVDYGGVVLSVTTGIPDAKAPVLIGEKCGNLFIGDKIVNQDVLNIIDFLKNIDGEARDRITEIAVDDKGNVKLSMRNSFPILIGHADEITDKSNIFMTVFKEIKNKSIDAEYIDLTFAKPYIKLIPSDSNKAMT